MLFDEKPEFQQKKTVNLFWRRLIFFGLDGNIFNCVDEINVHNFKRTFLTPSRVCAFFVKGHGHIL